MIKQTAPRDLASVTADHAFVVPAYNDSPFLADCLKSLRSQSVGSSIVVATSTPSRGIEATAAAFGVEVVTNPNRRSIGADWNFAMRATGKRFVTLAHQDDTYATNFLEKTSEFFLAGPDVTLVFTGCRQIDDDGKHRVSKVSLVKDALLTTFAGGTAHIGPRRARLLLSFGNPISCSSITFDRQKLGDFAFDETMASNLDWHAWLTLVERGDSLGYCPDRLIARRYNDRTETSRLIADGRRLSEDFAMFQRLWPKPIAWMLMRAYTKGYS